MSREECTQLAVAILALYPSIKEADTYVGGLFLLIGEYSYSVAMEAVRKLLKTQHYFPKPAEIYEAVAEEHRSQQKRIKQLTHRVGDDEDTEQQNKAIALIEKMKNSNYRTLSHKARVYQVAKHFYPDITDEEYRDNWLTFVCLCEDLEDYIDGKTKHVFYPYKYKLTGYINKACFKYGY